MKSKKMTPLQYQAMKLKKRGINPDQLVKVVFTMGEAFMTIIEASPPDGSLMKSMKRKLGSIVRIEPVSPNQILYEYHTTYRYYPNNPRVIAFKRRKELKKNLPKKFQGLPRKARKLNKNEFIGKISPEGIAAIKSAGYKDAEQFWQTCKYKNKPIPKVKK